MAHKFFYSWQSERPSVVCRNLIRDALEQVSETLNQLGIDERIEIDSDTQGVPGTPEILTTIFTKIEEDTVFIADLTICSETGEDEKKRLSPNPNVMFEYGYALRAKGRGRLICVMNTFYGGEKPTELPFDLRHARAPIRFRLSPDAGPEKTKKVFECLCGELLTAVRPIIDNLPNTTTNPPPIVFEKPQFEEGDELTPEGDFEGQDNATYFGACRGFVYVRARPLTAVALSIAQIKKMSRSTAALEISTGSSAGSFGTNKWGRIVYAIMANTQKRASCDYVQYYRSGELEIVNGSYVGMMKSNILNAGYLVDQLIAPMLRISQEWIEKVGVPNWLVEVGIIGIEKKRLTLNNFGAGPMFHRDKVAIQKNVRKDSILLLQQEFKTALLAEVGFEG